MGTENFGGFGGFTKIRQNFFPPI